MAKKSKGKGKDQGKGKGLKSVAGVKVPKALRTGLAGSLLDDPRTRQILADIIMAAAGAAAAALVQNRPTGRQVAEAGASAAGATRDVVQSATEAVTDTVAEAARHILPTSLTSARDESEEDDDKRSGRDDFAHLSDRDGKTKKDKHRAKASKH